MSGGLFAHDIGGSFSTAMDYMQQVYDQNDIWNAMQNDFGRRYPWDEFGYHFYISQGSSLQSSQLASYFQDIRDTQASNADPANVAVTEFGWQTAGTNTQALQRNNMATAYNFLEAQAYVTGTYWYQWTDDTTGDWGLVNGAGQSKLSFQEFVTRNATPPGDYNHNGSVDAADYAVWRKKLGGTYTSNDYNVWRAHFGQSAGGNSLTSGIVPEPATPVLLILAAASRCTRLRRKS